MNCLEGKLFKYPVDRFYDKLRKNGNFKIYEDIERLKNITFVFPCYLFSQTLFSVFWAHSKGLRPDINLLQDLSIGTEDRLNFNKLLNLKHFQPIKTGKHSFINEIRLYGVSFAGNLYERPKESLIEPQKYNKYNYGIIDKDWYYCENSTLFSILMFGG